LTSIVEALYDSQPASFTDPIPLLEESLSLFQRCLSIQELQYTESLAQQNFIPDSEPDVEEGGVPISQETSSPSSPSSAPQDDRWATILEPVTTDTLLDTLLAQLTTLTTLCTLTNDSLLPWTSDYASPLLTRLPTYLASPDLDSASDRQAEAALIRANFLTAAADANFRFHLLPLQTYTSTLHTSYSLDLDNNPEGLVNKAEALLTYNTSLRLFAAPEDEAQIKELAGARWQALSAALTSLTAASKLPSAENLPKIHLLRGDCEILRFQLSQAPFSYDAAVKNAATLLKNAEKFYRGAKGLAAPAGEEKEGLEASVKEALAAALSGEMMGIREVVKVVGSERVRTVLEEGVEEGIVFVEQLGAMGIA
jgi:hypothetical protein